MELPLSPWTPMGGKYLGHLSVKAVLLSNFVFVKSHVNLWEILPNIWISKCVLSPWPLQRYTRSIMPCMSIVSQQTRIVRTFLQTARNECKQNGVCICMGAWG